jgi:hypothetical protein
MSARYAPWSLRSWIVILLIAVPYVLLKDRIGFEYPAWARWFGIAVPLLAGTAILVSPRLAGMKSRGLALALGAVFVTAAVLGAYFEFKGA